MNLKNSNVIKTPKNLVSKLSNNKINNLFKVFKKNFIIKKSFAVAVSGGPDSLALAFFTKIFAVKNIRICNYKWFTMASACVGKHLYF